MPNPLAAAGQVATAHVAAFARDSLAVGEIFSRVLLAAPGTSRGARRLFLRTVILQIYFTGVQGVPVAGLLAFLVGYGFGRFVEAMQLHFLVPTFLDVLLARQLGPLLAVVVIVARSSAAVAVELGNMRVAGEIRMLEGFGIDPYRLLAMPRLAGIVIGTIALCFLVTAIALVAMMVVVRDHPAIGGFDALLDLAPRAGPRLLALGLLFGLVIALVSMHQGMNLLPRYTEVPKAASRAVVKSLVICALVDALVTAVVQ